MTDIKKFEGIIPLSTPAMTGKAKSIPMQFVS